MYVTSHCVSDIICIVIKVNSDRTRHTEPTISENETDAETHQSYFVEDQNDETAIKQLLSSSLPELSITSSYYNPFVVLSFLQSIPKRALNSNTKLTRFKVMKYLVKEKLVPVRISTLYNMLNDFNVRKYSPLSPWSDFRKRGRKPYLSSGEIMILVKVLSKECEGGLAMSLSELKERINNEIRKKYSKHRKLHLLPDVPECTLNYYASIIKSQSVFNLYNDVGNKTESRATAEWSIRSTICYLMAVACNHFIPCAEQPIFHTKVRALRKQRQRDLPVFPCVKAPSFRGVRARVLCGQDPTAPKRPG